jgi:hypothetical protein
MQNVKATITFTLETDKGEPMHKSTLEYNGLDEAGVLFLEKHLIDMLANLNTDNAGKPKK